MIQCKKYHNVPGVPESNFRLRLAYGFLAPSLRQFPISDSDSMNFGLSPSSLGPTWASERLTPTCLCQGPKTESVVTHIFASGPKTVLVMLTSLTTFMGWGRVGY